MQRPDQRDHREPQRLSTHQENPGDNPDETPHEDGEKRATAWEIIETILLALLIFLMVRGVVLNFRVDGTSMEPTLQDAEMLIINRRAYASIDFNGWLDILPGIEREPGEERYLFNPPQRGDIVVFHPPGAHSDPYIKRIIGLPGETIEIRDGVVFVNGIQLDEPYVSSETYWRESGGGGPAITVPEGEYFVLGDNRTNSSDSRVFGPVPEDNIIGKSWIAYWPPESVEILPRPTYALE